MTEQSTGDTEHWNGQNNRREVRSSALPFERGISDMYLALVWVMSQAPVVYQNPRQEQSSREKEPINSKRRIKPEKSRDELKDITQVIDIRIIEFSHVGHNTSSSPSYKISSIAKLRSHDVTCPHTGGESRYVHADIDQEGAR